MIVYFYLLRIISYYYFFKLKLRAIGLE